MKIRRAYKIIVGIVLLAVYIVATGIYVTRKYNELMCKGVSIEIDNSYAFINKDVVLKMLDDGGMVLDSTVKYSEIDFAGIERLINENVYVEETQAYGDFKGNVFVKIKQRDPMLRVITEDTASFYLDRDKKVMPLCDYFSADMLVLSGHLRSDCFYSSDSVDNYSVNHDKNSLNIDDICVFVNYLQSDDLWRNQITQVYVNESNELELVPRVGNHIILLGGLDDYETKMDKLEAMYSEGFDITGWNAYSVVNLKFKNQVICKRRNNG
ncbi:MAG: hypothetical protein IK025_11095 [Bacteroidales bacterium]|nr:hypothetical protein [Bacteroidales bacterium]